MSNLEPTGQALSYFNEVVLAINPKANIKAKSSSWQQKVIGFIFCYILPFNPEYMQRYITVIGDTIWMPSDELTEDSMFQTLVHETIHFKQKKKYGTILFSFLYLAPFTMSLLVGLLALLMHSWWVALAGLVLAAPIPALWRFLWEVQAYRVSLILADHAGYTQENKDKLVEWVVSQLSGRFYYFCWPFPNHVKSILLKPNAANDPIYSELHAFLIPNSYRARH